MAAVKCRRLSMNDVPKRNCDAKTGAAFFGAQAKTAHKDTNFMACIKYNHTATQMKAGRVNQPAPQR
jgi:hypothetical protein